MCVTGNVFSFITTSSELEANQGKETLVDVAMMVNSVIFCRVFPKQKVVLFWERDV